MGDSKTPGAADGLFAARYFCVTLVNPLLPRYRNFCRNYLSDEYRICVGRYRYFSINTAIFWTIPEGGGWGEGGIDPRKTVVFIIFNNGIV